MLAFPNHALALRAARLIGSHVVLLSLTVAFLFCMSLVVILSGKHPGSADVLLDCVGIPLTVKTCSLNSLFISFQYAELKKKGAQVINDFET